MARILQPDHHFLELLLWNEEERWQEISWELKECKTQFQALAIRCAQVCSHWRSIYVERDPDTLFPVLKFVIIQKLLREAISAREQMVRVLSRYVIMAFIEGKISE